MKRTADEHRFTLIKTNIFLGRHNLLRISENPRNLGTVARVCLMRIAGFGGYSIEPIDEIV
jgi:hypothetical protein